MKLTITLEQALESLNKKQTNMKLDNIDTELELIEDCKKHGVILPKKAARIFTDQNQYWISRGRGLKCFTDILAMREPEVLSYDGLGRKTFIKIKECLAERGYHFGMRFITKEGAMEILKTIKKEASMLEERIRLSDGLVAYEEIEAIFVTDNRKVTISPAIEYEPPLGLADLIAQNLNS